MEEPIKRRLIPVLISYSDKDYVWSFHPQEEGFNRIAFKADHERVKRLFRRIQVKDDMTLPHRFRGVTYQEIVDGIRNGSSVTIYVWRSKCPMSIEQIKKLLEE